MAMKWHVMRFSIRAGVVEEHGPRPGALQHVVAALEVRLVTVSDQ